MRPTAEARVIDSFGSKISVLLSSEETGGAFSLFRIEQTPAGGPPPHIHQHEDELFYVIEGDFEFFVDGIWRKASAGETVFLPKNSHHAFRNVGQTTGHLLVYLAPGGFEHFFDEAAAIFQCPGELDLKAIIEMSLRYGITYPGLEPATPAISA